MTLQSLWRNPWQSQWQQTTQATAIPVAGPSPSRRRRLAAAVAAFVEGVAGSVVWRLVPSGAQTRHALATGESDSLNSHSGAEPESLESFEAFFREHERAIFTYLYRVTGDEQTAYDLSQETFVRAWQRYERIRGYERPAAWLFHVATNLALNERRNRASAIRNAAALDAEHEPATSDNAWRRAERAAERDAIREALAALPARQRAALVLREVQGFSGEEVAAALGVSLAAAKMLLSRAREQFRRHYRSAEEEPREEEPR
jgi:RNA polymerase sigma-70 factor (ECF subfamily)